VHRAGHIVVEEVGEPGHAVTGVEELLQIAEATLQRLQTFEGEQSAGDVLVGPVGHEPLDVGGRADDAQCPVGILLRLGQLLRVVQRPLPQGGPRPRRLELGERQQRDVVTVGAVRVAASVSSEKRAAQRGSRS
jgi:hypothetical protein